MSWLLGSYEVSQGARRAPRIVRATSVTPIANGTRPRHLTNEVRARAGSSETGLVTAGSKELSTAT